MFGGLAILVPAGRTRRVDALQRRQFVGDWVADAGDELESDDVALLEQGLTEVAFAVIEPPSWGHGRHGRTVLEVPGVITLRCLRSLGRQQTSNSLHLLRIGQR